MDNDNVIRENLRNNQKLCGFSPNEAHVKLTSKP